MSCCRTHHKILMGAATQAMMSRPRCKMIPNVVGLVAAVNAWATRVSMAVNAKSYFHHCVIHPTPLSAFNVLLSCACLPVNRPLPIAKPPTVHQRLLRLTTAITDDIVGSVFYVSIASRMVIVTFSVKST